jgi:hypothetical protein
LRTVNYIFFVNNNKNNRSELSKHTGDKMKELKSNETSEIQSSNIDQEMKKEGQDDDDDELKKEERNVSQHLKEEFKTVLE